MADYTGPIKLNTLVRKKLLAREPVDPERLRRYNERVAMIMESVREQNERTAQAAIMSAEDYTIRINY